MRGPGGGFLLTRPADQIFVRDIVQAIDGFESVRRRCVLGLDECRDDQPCPLHDYWKGFRETFLGGVAGLTLEKLGETLERKRRAYPEGA